MRAVRLGGAQANDNLLILTATDLDAILAQANALKPQLLIIDSIQTMYNPELQTAAGSVGQVRECTAKLLQFSKKYGHCGAADWSRYQRRHYRRTATIGAYGGRGAAV